MSAGVKGGFDKLRNFETKLRSMSKVVAVKVAAKAAPIISDLAKATFEAGQDAYGLLWEPGRDGQKITLRKSGALERYAATYAAIGTRIRAVLGVPYAKYQIGKRPVLPRGALPVAYSDALKRIVSEVFAEHFGGGP